MTSSPELPVPDAAVDAALAQLTTEDGWIPARSGPTGSDLDQYCGPDGKLNDAEGLSAADEAAASFNRESLRRALAPVVAAVLRQLVAQADEDRGDGGPAYADRFFDGVNTVRDRAEKLADQLAPHQRPVSSR